MPVIDADLRLRLHDGLPPRVRGMADALIAEWEQAVGAVPELQRLAAEDVAALAAMPAEEREQALRRRWSRLHEVPVAGLPGRAVPRTSTSRPVAAH